MNTETIVAKIIKKPKSKDELIKSYKNIDTFVYYLCILSTIVNTSIFVYIYSSTKQITYGTIIVVFLTVILFAWYKDYSFRSLKKIIGAQ